MKKLFSYAALTAGLLAAPALAAAGDLSLTIVDGRVTLVAQDVTVRQILAEWARIGGTKIVNGDKLIGPPLTLELHDVPEGKALETVYPHRGRLRRRAAHRECDRHVQLRQHRDPGHEPRAGRHSGSTFALHQSSTGAAAADDAAGHDQR